MPTRCAKSLSHKRAAVDCMSVSATDHSMAWKSLKWVDNLDDKWTVSLSQWSEWLCAHKKLRGWGKICAFNTINYSYNVVRVNFQCDYEFTESVWPEKATTPTQTVVYLVESRVVSCRKLPCLIIFRKSFHCVLVNNISKTFTNNTTSTRHKRIHIYNRFMFIKMQVFNTNQRVGWLRSRDLTSSNQTKGILITRTKNNFKQVTTSANIPCRVVVPCNLSLSPLISQK